MPAREKIHDVLDVEMVRGSERHRANIFSWRGNKSFRRDGK